MTADCTPERIIPSTIISNVRQILSKDEFLEYANIYELRTEETDRDQGASPGEGRTREIVFKTNCRPLPS